MTEKQARPWMAPLSDERMGDMLKANEHLAVFKNADSVLVGDLVVMVEEITQSRRSAHREQEDRAYAASDPRRSAAPGRGESGAILPVASEASMNKEELPDASRHPTLEARLALIEMMAERMFLVSSGNDGANAEEGDHWADLDEKQEYWMDLAIAALEVVEDSQMSQSNDHAGSAEAAEVGAVLLRMSEDINFTEDEQITFRIAARLLACSPAPLHAGRGESDAIQGPSSDVVQNKGEKE